MQDPTLGPSSSDSRNFVLMLFKKNFARNFDLKIKIKIKLTCKKGGNFSSNKRENFIKFSFFFHYFIQLMWIPTCIFNILQ